MYGHQRDKTWFKRITIKSSVANRTVDIDSGLTLGPGPCFRLPPLIADLSIWCLTPSLLSETHVHECE